MSEPSEFDSDRRAFLSGKALRKEVERKGSEIADELLKDEGPVAPESGSTVRLSTQAMACDFSVVLNQGASEHLMTAADALELIHRLEEQMTVYRDDSEMSRINQTAYDDAVPVESQLFELLLRAKTLSEETEGGFDPTSGPLISLWRSCRQEGRIPDDAEITECLTHTGMRHVQFDEEFRKVQFDDPRTLWNLGGIGKGYALDRAGELLQEAGIEDWLLHGGFSSLLARGKHEGTLGWPVGIRNPLLPHETIGTILLKDRALSTSGSGVQAFRHEGQRYGHILDPRTGRPVEGVLSVTVLAPTAAEADALSTAFFVLGLEKAREYCDNHPNVSSLLIPPPHRGRSLTPIICNLPDDVLFLEKSTRPLSE